MRALPQPKRCHANGVDEVEEVFRDWRGSSDGYFGFHFVNFQTLGGFIVALTTSWRAQGFTVKRESDEPQAIHRLKGTTREDRTPYYAACDFLFNLVLR